MSRTRAKNRKLFIGDKPIIEFDPSKLNELRERLNKISLNDLYDLVQAMKKNDALPSDIVDYVKAAAVVRFAEELSVQDALIKAEEQVD